MVIVFNFFVLKTVIRFVNLFVNTIVNKIGYEYRAFKRVSAPAF